MGKATIIGGGADGLYTIEIDAGAQQQASRVEAINQELTTVAERIAQAETEYLATSTAETHAAGALNVAIENYVAAVAENPETASTADVDRLTADYYTAARFAGEARARLQGLLLQQRQLESDKATLANAPASETRQAWCVDLTEDAAGDVATIEVPGEPGTVLVAPGGRAPSASDGTLLARELMTPEQAFFNAAILPGWQKWMPTFRTGTITAVNSDNDTADVSLDDATSSAQGLGVNQTSSLSGVPIEYMECNAAAFEVGDPCVVRFDGQRWDAPRVVGFAREPKGCEKAPYIYFTAKLNQFNYTFEREYFYGTPTSNRCGLAIYGITHSAVDTVTPKEVQIIAPSNHDVFLQTGGKIQSISIAGQSFPTGFFNLDGVVGKSYSFDRPIDGSPGFAKFRYSSDAGITLLQSQRAFGEPIPTSMAPFTNQLPWSFDGKIGCSEEQTIPVAVFSSDVNYDAQYQTTTLARGVEEFDAFFKSIMSAPSEFFATNTKNKQVKYILDQWRYGFTMDEALVRYKQVKNGD